MYLLNCVIKDMIALGRRNIKKETEEKFRILSTFIDKNYQFAIEDPLFRSKTTLVINVEDSNRIIKRLKEKGMIVAAGYGENKETQIRIANFPSISIADIQALVKELKS
jgi:phosphoserine aminotransferase